MTVATVKKIDKMDRDQQSKYQINGECSESISKHMHDCYMIKYNHITHYKYIIIC